MKRSSLSISLIILAVLASVSPLPGQEPQNNPPRLQRNPAAALPTPAPRPERVNISYPGATKFNEGELREAIADQIQAINESGLSPALADDAAFFLTLHYRRNGYSQAEVKWEIASSRRLILKVNEGPFTELGEINFRGVQSLDEATLRDYIVGTTRERFSRFKDELPFIEADVKTGVERIESLYRSEGFLDVEVEAPQIDFSRGYREARVTIAVHEGTKYTFGKITFGGDLIFFPPPELKERMERYSEKPYTPAQVTNLQREVVYFYKTRGYFNAKVDVESDPATAVNGMVPVKFIVNSGEVYRFDGVQVTGLDRLDPDFLPNRFAKLNGQFYSPAKLDEVFRGMMRTGLFKTLRIKSVPLETNEIRLDIEVEEAKAKELGFLLGYGTFEGPMFGFQLGDRNLFGNGRPLTMRIEISQRFLKGEVLYVDPWFMESDYSLRLRLYGLTQEYDGYSKFETGFRSELARKLTKNLEVSAFILARQVQITSLGIDPLELGPTDYFTNSLGLAATYDGRDSAINPGRGFVINTTMDFATSAFGSSVEFLRSTGRFSYYLPIGKTLLAFGVRGGILVPMQGHEEVPIEERFFNGGSRSVRSFAERELGPKDVNGYPIGGETFTTFNIEYVFPIFGDLMGAVFTDAGSVGRTVSDGLGEMRYGVGAGLRYRLPVGPLRLDYGVNPNPKKDEERGAFHFSFGFAF
jgi:outer membrane protein insertion porin family